jgi:ppGpp synthetase/RelA/SpoT-type nucleotidyltranferase
MMEDRLGEETSTRQKSHIDMPESQIRQEYEKRLKQYNEMVAYVKSIVQGDLDAKKIPYQSIKGRVKEFDSFYEKTRRIKNCVGPFDQIEDICGVAVICLYRKQFGRIEKRLKTLFDVEVVESKSDMMPANQFGYDANHYIVRLNERTRCEHFQEIKCEIQVRTILMDAWASISHELDYKESQGIPEHLKRNFYALSGLLYIGDSDIEHLRQERERYYRREANLTKKSGFDMDKDLNRDSLVVYAKWRLPNYWVEGIESKGWSNLLADLRKANITSFSELEAAAKRFLPGIEKKIGPSPDLLIDLYSGIFILNLIAIDAKLFADMDWKI